MAVEVSDSFFEAEADLVRWNRVSGEDVFIWGHMIDLLDSVHPGRRYQLNLGRPLQAGTGKCRIRRKS